MEGTTTTALEPVAPRRGRPGAGARRAVPATMAVWLALAVAGLIALPASPEPVTAPATLIWQFRLATLAGAVALWSVLGLTFGWLRLSRR